MYQSYLRSFLLRFCFFIVLSIPVLAWAEGSKNLFPTSSPAAARRAYIADGSLVYAYAKSGEILYLGSNALDVAPGKIIVTSPTGVVTTFIPNGSVGLIDTRTKELNGPSTFTAGGYTPATVAVGTTGIWKIQFIANGSANPSFALVGNAWDNSSATIAAWDVTVGTASAAIPGRAYMTVVRGNMGAFNFGTGSWWSTLYAQTRDGYRYSVNTNGLDPFGFQFFVNNKGVRKPGGASGPPSYISANSTDNGSFIATGLDVHNPDLADDVSNVTHKLFFTTPANDLPTTSTVFLTAAVNTWLLTPPVNPSVTGVSLVGLEGQNGFGGTPPISGGFINFTANQNGSYRIRIDGNNNGIYTDAIDTVLTGTAAAGPNSRYWSGKNGLGAIMPSGTPLSVEVVTFAGEVHFPLFDAEENINGLVITRENGSGAPSNTVFWNDTKLLNTSNNPVSADANTSSPLDASADPGINSATNGHKWKNGSQDIPSNNQGFGNFRLMDTWAFVYSSPITVVTTLITKEANLEMVSLTGSPTNTCVGSDITYTFVAKNNGPDDAPLSKISFVTPTNLTNLQVISATLNTGIATGIGGTFTGNIYNDTLTTFNNGAQITYIIKGTVSSWPTGNNLNTSARILRPSDVTDPDASNPDPAPPTDPVNECNSAPSGVGCNNIKDNTVTIFALPTTSVAAVVSATQCNSANFTMAANTPTAGTGLWTLVSGTANIATPASATTSVTGVPAGGSAVLKWTVSNGTCPASESTITLNNTAAPSAAIAGANQTQCNNGAFTLAATAPSVGTGLWSLVSGTAIITTPSSATTTVTGVPAGSTAVLKWTVSNGICTPSSANISLSNLATPTTSVAGANQQNCNSGSFTLAANTPSVGNGLWTLQSGTANITTPSSATSTVTGVPAGTSAVLVWTITNGICAASTSTVTVNNQANPTTAIAGGNQTQCGNGSFTMAANAPLVGTGLWTIVSGAASITTPASPTTTITGVTAGTTVVLRWTITNGICAASSSDITLINKIAPNTSIAGTNQIKCNDGNFSITANAAITGTTGVWSVVNGTATIANVNNASTTISGVPAGSIANLRWTISNAGCTSTSSDIGLSNQALPTAAIAGSNQNLCNASSVNLSANTPLVGTGLWTLTSGPNTANITAISSAVTGVTGMVAGTYIFTWTISNGSCAASANSVTINNLPTVNAGADIAISCVTSASLTAASAGELWTAVAGNPANAAITNAGAISGFLTRGAYKFVLSNGACTDTVIVTRNNCAPTANNTTATVNEDNPLNGALAANTSDFDGDALSFSLATAPSNGTVVVNADGTFRYIPNANFNGNDTLFYRVCDPTGACTTARLIITVNPINDPPIAVNDNASTVRDVPVTGNLSSNDRDIEGQPLTVQTTPAANPVNGSVVLNANGTYTYTPNPGFTGVDSFKYTICDPGPLCSVATVTVNITPGVIDLTLTKTASPKPVVAGSALTYTITVTNNGPSTIRSSESFLVKDDLPIGFTPTSFTPSGGVYTAATNSWTGLQLAPAGAATLKIVGTVSPAFSASSITNTVTSTPPAGTTDPSPATATDITNVNKAASIVVTKTNGASSFAPGNPLVYTITVTNNGPSDVLGGSFADPLPAGITSASWTATTQNGAVIPANTGIGGIAQLVNIPNGASIVYTVTLLVPSNFTSSTIANTAIVTFPAGVTNTTPGTNTVTDTDTRNPIHALRIVKTAPAVAAAGGAIRYQLTIDNDGPSDLINAAINDIVPANITNIRWSNLVQGSATVTTVSGTGNNINFNTTIPAGSANRLILTIDGTINPAATGTINNTATVTPVGSVAIPSNTTVTEVQTITGLQIVKAGPSSSTVVAGQGITYTIELINSGPSNATNIAILDNVPAAIQNVSWSVVTKNLATASVPAGTGNTIALTGNIPAGNANGISIVVSGFVASAQLADIVNTVTATPAVGTAVTAQTVTKVLNQPRLTISKSAPTTVAAGAPISFTIVAGNAGSSDAFGALLADTITNTISNLTWTAVTTGTASIVGAATGSGNIVGLVANIPTGTANTIVLTVNGIVNPAATGTINNIANIRIPGGTPTNSNRTTTTVTNSPNISITKGAPATLSAGEQISYTLRVVNNGPSNAYDVVVRDTLASVLTNVTVTTQTLGAAAIGSAGNDGGNRIVGRNLDIPAGNANAVIITISGIVPASFSGVLNNTAYAQAPGQPIATSNPVATSVNITPGLKIIKAGPAQISAGQRISYTVTVTNSGPSNASGITITDLVNSNIKNVSWRTVVDGAGTVVLTGATGTGNAISVTGNITARAISKIDVVITGMVDSSYSGTISNTATVSGGGSPTISSNPYITTVNKTADLTVTKFGPQTISAGSAIRYTITARNQGPSLASNASITDIVPADITNVSWTAVASGSATILTGATGTGNNISVTATISNNTITTDKIDITVLGTVKANATASTLVNIANAIPAAGTTDPTPATDTVRTALVNRADVRVVKTGPGSRAVNQTITYNIIVVNRGPAVANDFVVTDTIPANIGNISFTSAVVNNATILTSNLTGNILTLTGNIGAAINDTVKIQVNGVLTAPGTYTNRARITAPGDLIDPSLRNNISTVTTNVTNQANITIAKIGPARARVKDIIQYRIDIANSGLSDANGVVILDTVPASLTNISWTVVKNTGGVGTSFTANTAQNQSIIDIAANLQGTVNGAGSISVFVTGTLANNAPNIVTNKAMASFNSITKTSTVNTSVDNTVNLTISKTAPNSLPAGNAIQYNIIVGNNGPADAVNATINDLVPATITNTTWSIATQGAATLATGVAANGTGNTINAQVNIPSGNGNQIVITVNGTVASSATGSVSNTATVVAGSGQTDLTPASSTVVTNLTQVTNIQISKTGAATLAAGNRIIYTLFVNNAGPSDANAVVIADAISNNISSVSWSATALGNAIVTAGSTGTGNAISSTVNLPAGINNAIRYTITGTVNPGFVGTINNTATATNGATVITTPVVATVVTAQPGLIVSKSGPTAIAAGESINYNIKVTNIGPSNANGITITDAVTANITNASWVATATGGAVINSGAAGVGNAISVGANLNAGAGNEINIAVTGVVNSGLTATNFSNFALASGGGSPIVSSDTIITSVSRKADITISKAAPASIIAGERIRYSIIVRNNGPSDAVNTAMADQVPASIINTSWSATANGGANVSVNTGTGNTINLTGNIPTGATNFIELVVNGTVDPSTAVTAITNTATASAGAGITDPTPASASATTSVSRQADVKIVKSAPGTRATNQSITYELVVTNTGYSNATGITISDIIPASITGIAFTTSTVGNATVTGSNLTGNTLVVNGNIASGTDTIKVKITGILSAPGILTNTATVSLPGGQTDPNLTNNTSSVSTNVTTQTDIIIAKKGPATVNVNDEIEYKIEVDNLGVSDAYGVSITDLVSADITNVSWTIAKTGNAGTVFTANSSQSSNTVDITADIEGTVNGPGSIIITIKGKVANNAGASITNMAQVDYAGIKQSAVTTIVNNSADLSIQKTAPTTADAGAPIRYHIIVRNNGPANASNISIADLVPANIGNVSWTAVATGTASVGTANGTGNNINLTGSINAGVNNSILVTINGTVNAGATGVLTNTASVLPDPSQVDPTPATATVNTTLTNNVNLQINKAAPNKIIAGTPISYTITVSNGGPSNANGVGITDAVPIGITGVTWSAVATGTATINNGAVGTGNAVNILADLPSGGANTIVVTVNGMVSAAFTGTLNNTASLTYQSNPAGSSATVTVVTTLPTLLISKAAPKQAAAGTIINYTVDITNIGPSDANGINIADIVPASIKAVSWMATAIGNASVLSGATGMGNTVAVTGNIIAGAGNRITLLISGKIDSTFSGTIANTVTAQGAGAVPVNSTINTVVNLVADIAIQKAGPQNLVAGEPVQYSLIISNTGPSSANGITISDIVPAGITNTSWSATANGNAAIVTGATGVGNTVALTANISTGATDNIIVTIKGILSASAPATPIVNTATVSLPIAYTDPNAGNNSASITTVVSKVADLRIVKTGPADRSTNQSIVYTLVVTNNGPSAVTGYTITDLVPVGITNITAASVATGTATAITTVTGNNVSVTGNIGAAVGDSIKVTITGIAASTGVITNTATVKLPLDIIDPVSSNDTSIVATTVTNNVGVIVSKTGPASVNVRDNIQYSIDITNSGLSDANGIAISDLVSPAISNVTWSVVKLSGNANTNFVTNTPLSGNNIDITANVEGSINGPGALRILINGTIADNAPGAITNIATAVFEGTKTSTVTSIVNNSVDLNIVKSGPTNIAAGLPITYTVVMVNNGPAPALNAILSDTVPSPIKNISWTATVQGTATLGAAQAASGTGNNINIIGNLPVGAANAITLTITGMVDANYSGVFTNIATAKPSSLQVDPTPASSMVNTTVSLSSNLQIVKSGTANIAAGMPIAYTLVVNNAGPSNAKNIIIADLVPATINAVSYTATTSGAANIISGATGSGNNIQIAADIPAGVNDFITVQINGTVNAAFTGNINNTATVTNGGVSVVSNAAATVVTNQSNIRITKSGASTGIAGERMIYQLEITNTGPSDANGLTIADIVPAELTNTSWTSNTSGNALVTSGITGTGNTINLVGNIAAGIGNKINIVIAGVINPSFAGTISNRATATTAFGVVNNSEVVNTVVSRRTAVQISKVAAPTVVAGNRLSYVINISNAGPSDAVNIAINDPVPSILSNVSFTATGSNGATVSTANGIGNAISITANIPAGAAPLVRLLVSGTVDPSFSGNISNTATAQAPGGALVLATAETVASRIVDIEISKAAPSIVLIGNQLRYRFTIRNNGPSAADGANFTDVFSSAVNNLSFAMVSATAGLTGINPIINGNTVNATIASFPVGGIAVFEITGIAINAGIITNTATITAPIGVTEPNTGNNTAGEAITNIYPKPPLKIVKSIDPATGPYYLGQVVTYTLTIKNSGVISVLPVQVKDLLPNPAKTGNLVLATPSSGTAVYSNPANQITWDLPFMAAGEVATVKYSLKITDTGRINNTAIITGPVDIALSDTAKLDFKAVLLINLKVLKSLQAPTVLNVKDEVGFTIEAENQGPNNATNVVVLDPLKSNLDDPRLIVVTKGTFIYNPTTKTITWTIGDMLVGEKAKMTLTGVRINSGGLLENTATISGFELEANSTDNIAEVRTGAGNSVTINGEEIFIPNTITPNGDGKNDRFRILGIQRFPGSRLNIYNRWGNVIYQSNSYNNEFDGANLTESTYFYTLDLKLPAGGIKKYSGWIQIMR